MKSKITWKLTGYFTVVLLLFAVVVGALYLIAFTHNTIELSKQGLKERAINISGKLSEFSQMDLKPGRQQGQGQGNGFGAYFRSLEDIAMADVWVTDQNADLIEFNHGNAGVSNRQLPEDAEKLAAEVFTDEVVLTENFTGFLQAPDITAGAPIYGDDKTVVAAVILQADVAGMNHSIWEGIKLLFVILLVALLAAGILSIFLAAKFNQPLRRMEETTQKLANGEYDTRTGIKQKDEIGTLAQNMDILAERLKRASKERAEFDKMQKDFIATVSHELRTPVTVIRGSLELLCDGVIKPEEMQEYFEQMMRDSICLQRMVNDLLELSKLQNEEYRMEMCRLNLVEVLEDAVRSLRGPAKEKELTLLFESETADFAMVGDYGRLRQMFIVVLDNAVKFSNEGGKILIKARDCKDEMIIEITDYGQGISFHDLEHIFEKFYHVKTEQNKTGSGLGLTVAKQIAERHYVKLECESQETSYTTFRFTCKGVA